MSSKLAASPDQLEATYDRRLPSAQERVHQQAATQEMETDIAHAVRVAYLSAES